MSAILLNMARDVQGNNAYAPPFTQINMSTILTSAEEQNFTVPTNFTDWIAVFSYAYGNVLVANNFTAEIPTGSFANTTSQLMPACRHVKANDVLSFITPDATATVGVSLYGLS